MSATSKKTSTNDAESAKDQEDDDEKTDKICLKHKYQIKTEEEEKK